MLGTAGDIEWRLLVGWRAGGAQGFEPLFESLTLWGPEDAALVLVKALESPE